MTHNQDEKKKERKGSPTEVDPEVTPVLESGDGARGTCHINGLELNGKDGRNACADGEPQTRNGNFFYKQREI